MSEFVLDIVTHPQRDDHSVNGSNSYTKYFFQIDISGNVYISEQSKSNYFGEGEKKNILSINDNIPVPNYFINIIKSLILQITFEEIDYIGNLEHNIIQFSALGRDKGLYGNLYKQYWAVVIDTIKRIKQEVKKLVENPQDNLDIKEQLDIYITKTKQQQENIVDLENKIKNIQTAYFDTINDNKKLKELIKTKDNKQTELEIENKRLLQELNNRVEKERLWIEYKLQNPLYR